MFEQSFVAGAAKTRKAWTVPVCFVGQLAVVGGLALMPVVFYEGLPLARLTPMPLTVPGTYHPPDPPHVQLVATGQERGHVFREPSFVQKGVHLGPDRPADLPEFVPAACQGTCVPDSVGPAGPPVLTRWLPPAPPERTPVPVIRAVRATPTPTPIPVSPGVQEAKLIHKVIPVYPRLGIQIHLAGTVRLAAIIGTDGRIRELRVLSGHPILVTPAVEAVQQWVYQPTMLGTTAMEVMTEITVNFNLTRN